SGPVSVAPPPQAAAGPDAAAIRRAIAAQGLTDTSHPLLQATEEGGQDWFSNGMMANLDRYKAAGAPR
ncbi:MAG: hypothetical protein HQL41_08155, partial [Alphaproteobacteria bacterium]|nr:hypothetical protein [Alphaproteobacteria bacterium]